MIRTAAFFIVLVVSTLFFSLLSALFGLLRAKHAAFDWIHRNWSRSLVATAGTRVEVHGLEHLEPGRAQIFVANHQSFFDVWALMVALPVSLRFVTKAELGRIPVLAQAMRAAGHVLIERDKAARAGSAIRAAGDRMRKEGLAIVLFPEGTRSADGELGRFLRGSFALAIETGAHLIPTTIDGGREVFQPGGRRVRPGTMHIHLAPAVPLAGLSSADRDELMRETKETIRTQLDTIRA